MSKFELNVLFKKIQKDDKKEVLEFHVQGDELPHSKELIELAGNIVVLEIEASGAGKFNAEFKAVQRDSKKTTLKFNAKGDSDEKMIKLYPHAGRTVKLSLEPSQMSIEDFNNEEPREGVKYNVGKDGTANVVSPDQMSIEDVKEEEQDEDLLN
ncbi:hypothetical protein KHA94_00435 [Bacillus sp. FJAT-49705]|uniref:Uncharacterized protein n=1 Tax=Cytobacillus citreus TaxID=2833586 RepID=A0ABS5NLJ4_9BACI|nr:hypothetical protein [Cytobacillus citreus]MBS4188687.1 hypothetical protein [Cytobacillus citreus]